MSEMLEKLELYFQFPFVRYALIVGILIALCSSLLGITLVLKRFSFIGDGLSHVAFGAMAVAAVLGQTDLAGLMQRISITPIPENAGSTQKIPAEIRRFFADLFVRVFLDSDMPLMLIITILCAVLLLRTGQNAKIKGDAAVAMISVGALAIGYLLMNKFSRSSNLSGDVCSTLFGSTSILTLTQTEVWLCVILSALVLAIFILFYNKIFAVTFDESFAQATGVQASAYNLLIAVVIAVIIVLAMNLVGSLLISALVIFPALSAMRLFKSFRSVTIFAAIYSVLTATIGILASILGDTPVGSTIVAVEIAVFVVCWIIGLIKGGIRA